MRVCAWHERGRGEKEERRGGEGRRGEGRREVISLGPKRSKAA
jgi:hypothetical protein